VGAGFGGPVDAHSGTVRTSHHVPGWNGFPLKQALEARFGLPVVVDNDARAGALGELRFGAGQGHQNMVYINVGTGIGGGLVFDRHIYRGPTGMGAELGHIILNPDGPRCGCGNHGCFEAYASGTALSRMAREAAEDDPDGAIARLGAEEGEVSGHAVVKAIEQGDATAKALFERFGRWLGIGIASLANIFEVDAVVVGGGLVETGDLLLAPARLAAREFAYAPTARGVAPIVPATFGVDAGKIGAALLALDHA
jgi:glucokinase